MREILILSVVASAAGCVSPPRPTAAARALDRNLRAVVEGRVVDSRGSPAAGIRVEAIPRGKDTDWSLPAITDSEGRFTLTLFAPAEYGFVLRVGETTVVTADPRDPARVHIDLAPGERRAGIELFLLREKWREIVTSFQ